jgi:2-polyprenyl-6-methoxyphenol hydroxylase-like FAD-dependent oxidoreductase
VLALWLTRAGISVRIIDKAAEAGTTSRALVVHARTLEFYRQLGIDQAIVGAGLEFTAVNLWVSGRRAARIALGEIGSGASAFPYMLILPQDEHERLLIAELAKRGVDVERRTELVSLREAAGRVETVLRTHDGSTETYAARYVAGADGAHSAVRAALGVGFPGGTYERMFYVADVQADGPVMNKELHVALDAADFVAVFPLAGEARARFIGSIRPTDANMHAVIEWKDVSERAISHMRVDVRAVNWFSTYHVHHRVAEAFQRGRVFLLGDAAHIHSPVGGQGMNTGIGDAVNLAWKLANVIQSGAPESLLTTYEPERIAFAERLVATTDRAFTVVTRDGPIARVFRLRLLPTVLGRVSKLAAARRFMFRTLSQTAIEYRASPLSRGGAGRIRAGDRLPWVARATGEGLDNYGSLGTREWQIHVYGEPADGLADLCERRGLGFAVFPWSSAMARVGLRQGAAYVVRPDGHIAFADPRPTRNSVMRFLDDKLRGFTGRSGSGYLRHSP